MLDIGEPKEYVTRRPPILQATATLGIRDADVARALGVTSMVVSEWASGKRPIPLVRHVALSFVVTRALGHLRDSDSEGRFPPPSEKAARRIEAAWDVAIRWLHLADKERGGEPPLDVLAAALALLARNGDSLLPYRAVELLDAAWRKGEVRDLIALLETLLAEEEQQP